ncbi:MAG: M20 family metallo-hydrolase [Lachnospiraceae bacterium]|nr:M20 family metallo-hydrolase [Lachnospiraceae bacterium]
MDIYAKISQLAAALEPTMIERRRDLHKYAESGWYEMRTSSIIARILTELGYKVLTGRQVCEDEERMGLPSPGKLEEHFTLSLAQGAVSEFMTEDVKNGFTGVIGILSCGEGPVTALRFDIDALGGIETEEADHKPNREGFSSVNHGVMHACGHDGHTAIGLAVAEILTELKDALHGTVKLIFQPAEEGVKGGKSVVGHGHLDDVDFFLSGHIYSEKDAPDCDVITGTVGPLATCKYDVTYHGKAAHAGTAPQRGKNALLAAVAAVQELMSIPRYMGGTSLVNVGKLISGTARNVIPDEAFMEVEVRGDSQEILAYMKENALRIIKAAADLQGCTADITVAGEAEPLKSDESFAREIADVLTAHLPDIRVSPLFQFRNPGSEDASFMMNRVQSHGGKAVYMRFLTELKTGVHERRYDFNEAVMKTAAAIYAAAVFHLLTRNV